VNRVRALPVSRRPFPGDAAVSGVMSSMYPDA
jgi:hypothetical protein